MLDLPAALDGFYRFQSERDGFVTIDSMHELEAMGAAVLVCLAALGYGIHRWIRRIKRRRLREAQNLLANVHRASQTNGC